MIVKNIMFFAAITLTPYASNAQEILSIPLNVETIENELGFKLNTENAYAIVEVPSDEELHSMGYTIPEADISYLNKLAETDSIHPTAKINNESLSQIMSEAYKRYGIPEDIIPEQEPTIIVNDPGPVQAPGGGHEPFPNVPGGGQPSGPSNPPSEPTLGNNVLDRATIEMFRTNESNVFAVE